MDWDISSPQITNIGGHSSTTWKRVKELSFSLILRQNFKDGFKKIKSKAMEKCIILMEIYKKDILAANNSPINHIWNDQKQFLKI